MNLIAQFRRLLFAQVLLGIAVFCIAEQNMVMLVAAVSAAALSWYVTEGPSGQPLPRRVTNIAAVVVLMVLLWRLLVLRNENMVLVMGHFTMWLQIVLLYRDKKIREEGQLLVLSVVQMIAASVVSISMTYGILLVIYCILALATALLFQLKATSDYVHHANRQAAPSYRQVAPPEAVVGRGHRWHMRTMGLAIGIVCATVAVVVFVVTPRRDAPSMQAAAAQSMGSRQPGFSETVNLDGGPGDGGGQQQVLQVQILENGEPLEKATEPIYLRGAALDHYHGRTRTWTRSQDIALQDRATRMDGLAGARQDQQVDLAQIPEDISTRQARITLRNSRNPVLFTLYPGPVWFDSDQVQRLVFNALDLRLAAIGSRGSTLVYHLRSPSTATTRTMATMLQEQYQQSLYGSSSRFTSHSSRVRVPIEQSLSGYARGWQGDTQRLRDYARGVIEARGLERDPALDHAPQDGAVAGALAEHLAGEFGYALENPRPPRGEDPVAYFLFEERSGHCEIFAAAHAALCRVLGIPARVVTGYLATDYNRLGKYYTVRQRNAHAWTEVNLGPEIGWRRFEPTPPQPLHDEHRPPTGWTWELRQLHNYLEFTWLGTVVAYDTASRRQVFDEIHSTVSEATQNEERWLGKLIGYLRRTPELWRLERINYTLAGFIVLSLGLALASLVRTIVLRHRRMATLQLTSLPRGRRRELARALGFYIQMLDMLERHGYVRPPWQSPQAFAHELAEANPMRFDPIVALTEIFYEVRFGHRPLDEDRRHRVRAHLRHLEHALTETRV